MFAALPTRPANTVDHLEDVLLVQPQLRDWLGYFVVPAHRRESERRTSGDALEMNIEEILDLGQRAARRRVIVLTRNVHKAVAALRIEQNARFVPRAAAIVQHGDQCIEYRSRRDRIIADTNELDRRLYARCRRKGIEIFVFFQLPADRRLNSDMRLDPRLASSEKKKTPPPHPLPSRANQSEAKL